MKRIRVFLANYGDTMKMNEKRVYHKQKRSSE